jgi:hypothetical protein
MTQLEDRLRRDLSKFAERARTETIRGPRQTPVRSMSRRMRWLAPAASVVAVMAVVAGISLVGAHGPSREPKLTFAPPTPAAPASLPGGMPRYYVTVYQSFTPHNGIITVAVVHSSATGRALTRVKVPTLVTPDGVTGPGISGAADDRTFIITEPGTLSTTGPDRVWFYKLKLAADGRSALLTRLPISLPVGIETDGTDALSPDGTQLAIGEVLCQQGDRRCYTALRVVTIATGAARTWTMPKTAQAGYAWLSFVSWAGDSTVAFLSGGPRLQYQLVNVTGHGGSLLAARAIASPPPPRGVLPEALVTANGSTVIGSTVTNIADGNRVTVIARIIEISARTGKLLRVLSTQTVHGATPGMQGSAESLDSGCRVLSLAPSGTNVLASCFAFGRVSDEGFTPLPGFPSPSTSGIEGQDAAAW